MNKSTMPQPEMPMERLLYEVKKVIVGQDHLLERMIVALLARGHLLVEGVPGLAKTLAIKTLAEYAGGAVAEAIAWATESSTSRWVSGCGGGRMAL